MIAAATWSDLLSPLPKELLKDPPPERTFCAIDSLRVGEKESEEGGRTSPGLMLGFELGVTGGTFACGGVSGEVVTGVTEEAKIVSRLRAAALTDDSKPFFTKADRYSSKARSDCKTGEDESYSSTQNFYSRWNSARHDIRIRKAFPISK